jgi:tripartite-type tricarboxylate transporter receptor subunit TctC
VFVPFPPGGGTDIIAREVTQRVSTATGWTFVIENRPGAGGMLGVDAVAKAQPDGYLLAIGVMGALSINTSLQEKMPYDAVRDLAPVGMLAVQPFVMTAPASAPFNSIRDVVTMARAEPDRLSIGYGGNGTAMHLTALLFNHEARLNIQLVPYRGSALVMSDVAAGHIPLGVSDITSGLSMIRSGHVKPLAVSSAARFAPLPEVPTFAEAALPGYESSGWFGVVAPAGTPPQVIALLNEAIVDALGDPATVERLRAVGVEPAPTSPEEFGRVIESDIVKWRRVIADAGIKPN